MLDGTDLLNAVKKAALDAVNAGQPSDFCYGKVTSVNPLKILVEQKMPLGSAQLILSRNVTDYKTKVTIDWATESKSGGSGDSSYASHNHSVSGTKEMTVHNGLQIGDEVILLKKKGGQKYLVLDRAVKA